MRCVKKSCLKVVVLWFCVGMWRKMEPQKCALLWGAYSWICCVWQKSAKRKSRISVYIWGTRIAYQFCVQFSLHISSCSNVHTLQSRDHNFVFFIYKVITDSNSETNPIVFSYENILHIFIHGNHLVLFLEKSY